jgi:hypothetical protein
MTLPMVREEEEEQEIKKREACLYNLSKAESIMDRLGPPTRDNSIDFSTHSE